jgi:uncharacterized C2H2 Zn-finger protein
MLRMIKRFIKAVRMKFCNHDFGLVDTEYNNVNRKIGCGRLWYKCPKCGKVFHVDVNRAGKDASPRGWCHGISKRWSD